MRICPSVSPSPPKALLCAEEFRSSQRDTLCALCVCGFCRSQTLLGSPGAAAWVSACPSASLLSRVGAAVRWAPPVASCARVNTCISPVKRRGLGSRRSALKALLPLLPLPDSHEPPGPEWGAVQVPGLGWGWWSGPQGAPVGMVSGSPPVSAASCMPCFPGSRWRGFRERCPLSLRLEAQAPQTGWGHSGTGRQGFTHTYTHTHAHTHACRHAHTETQRETLSRPRRTRRLPFLHEKLWGKDDPEAPGTG